MNHNMKVQSFLNEEARRDTLRVRELFHEPRYEYIKMAHGGHRYAVTNAKGPAGICDSLFWLSPLTDALCALKADQLVYEELLAHRMDLLQSIADGSEWGPDDTVVELCLEMHIARARVKKLRHAALADMMIRDVLAKYDAMVRWEKRGRPLPWEIYKWLAERKTPATIVVKQVNEEFVARYRAIQARMDEQREKGNDGEWWDLIWKERDRLVEKWKEAIIAVV